MTRTLDSLDEDCQQKLRRQKPPKSIAPMLATLVHEPFSDAAWIYERKFDGVRCLVFRNEDSVRLVSRNHKPMNATWPEIVEAVRRDPCRDFGALLVGTYEGGELRYAGKVGTGDDAETLHSLGRRLRRLERKTSPFSEGIDEPGVHFVRPELVGEFAFTEWTRAGKLRHPRFLGLRTDKSAEEVHRERGLETR